MKKYVQYYNTDFTTEDGTIIPAGTITGTVGDTWNEAPPLPDNKSQILVDADIAIDNMRVDDGQLVGL